MRRVFSVLTLLFLILIPIGVGLYIRFDDGKVWRQHREIFYYKDRPLFTSYDAFYFARWSREEVEKTYKAGKLDHLRFVPDNYITGNVTYPSPIPMESYIGAGLAKIFDTHIENISYYLTPLYSILFVVPFVLYFYRLGLPVSGFGGALLGSISLIYLIRTSICRFDTDSLNLFFPFMAGYLLFETYRVEDKKLRIALLILAGLTLELYNWWYSHPGLVTVIFMFYLIYIASIRRINFSKGDWKNLTILFLFSNPLTIIEGVKNFYGSVYTYLYSYFHKSVGGGFPNVQMSIGEQKHFNLKLLSEMTAGNEIILIVGLASFLFLLYRYWKFLVPIIPVFLIGLISFKGGNRFAMYLSPFIGAGLGFLADLLVKFLKDRERLNQWMEKTAVILISIFIGAGFVFANEKSVKFVAFPKITPGLTETFLKLREVTPEGSWIWTWWDYGYAIQYYSNRAVYHDGGSQVSPKTYFVATTFSTSDPRVAYNTILGISNLGAKGIEDLIKKGVKPQEIRDEIFSGEFSKPIKHPVFWIFTSDEFGKFGWINYFGTWNFDLKRGRRGLLKPLKACTLIDRNILNCDGLLIDLNKGTILVSKREVPIKYLVVREESKIGKRKFSDRGLIVEFISDGKEKMAFLEDEQVYRSMFNQMYILRNYNKSLFKLVWDNFPTSVVYQVRQ